MNASIRGFSLGMTKDAVSKQIDGLKWAFQKDGSEESKATTFTDTERFEGVRSINFSVFENVLFRISIDYGASVTLENIGTFGQEIAKSWKINEKWFGEDLFK